MKLKAAECPSGNPERVAAVKLEAKTAALVQEKAQAEASKAAGAMITETTLRLELRWYGESWQRANSLPRLDAAYKICNHGDPISVAKLGVDHYLVHLAGQA